MDSNGNMDSLQQHRIEKLQCMGADCLIKVMKMVRVRESMFMDY